ncbi:conjugal transfer protein TrbL family protein [Chakrabartyella piscis]|uniref:conjugal transfer protein TrbL family protein n=1 Tax=Chakrabartyella piscis TaxID=2918914 RepID=UPI002958CD27|nr:conjugal transfer protein TrbL family protein [Chakrabartyella piscis]
MYVFDLAVDGVLDQFCDWIYGSIIEFFGEFFTMMNLMGAELFEMDWIQGLLLFFYQFAWCLFIVGIVVAVFDMAIEAQKGKNTIQDLGLNILKGFFAVSLFTIIPIELYTFSVNLSGELIYGLTSLTSSPDDYGAIGELVAGSFQLISGGIFIQIVLAFMIGYAVIKVFFANLKRGGILIILMGVGSLYMFSVPRGYGDGFVNWCKQVIALCMTAFLQTIILIAGLVTFNANMLLGIGVMLSATEVPRIANNFGLDTSMNVNMMSVMYSTQAVTRLIKK